jgi:hypothetical protein
MAAQKAVLTFTQTTILLALLIGTAAHAASDEWQFRVTPYLWLPSIDANLNFETGGSEGSADMSNLLKHLEAAFFLNADARKGNWGLSFDFVYCDFSKESSNVTSISFPRLGVEVPINSGTTTGLTGSMYSLMGTYALADSGRATLDALAGARYTHVGASLDWSFAASVPGLSTRTGSAGADANLWDGVIGVRGRATIASSPWYVPYYLDAGAGTSKFTWQGLTGVGYGFGWGDVLLAYRYLSFDVGAGEGVQRLTLSGPTLGATFRF